MLRSLAVISVLFVANPLWAETTEQRTERCAAQNAIVEQAIDLRLKRKSEAKAKEIILSDDSELAQKYATSVPSMVGLIYSMKRRDVRELDTSSFEAACLAYEQ